MEDPLNEEELEAIDRALEGGQKIEAIKIFREATGKSLKEAKDAVEDLIVDLKEKEPEKYSKLSSNQGCSSAIVLLAGVITLITYAILS